MTHQPSKSVHRNMFISFEQSCKEKLTDRETKKQRKKHKLLPSVKLATTILPILIHLVREIFPEIGLNQLLLN